MVGEGIVVNDHGSGLRRWRTPRIIVLSWAMLLPAIAWAVATQYVPLLGPALGSAAAWAVGIGAALLLVGSVLLHTWAHTAAARLLDADRPERSWLGPFGDAAQTWPAAVNPWSEAGGAVAGPVASVVVAGALYLVWDRQWHPWLNVACRSSMANVVIAALNMAPGFPLDGGRLARRRHLGAIRAARLGHRRRLGDRLADRRAAGRVGRRVCSAAGSLPRGGRPEDADRRRAAGGDALAARSRWVAPPARPSWSWSPRLGLAVLAAGSVPGAVRAAAQPAADARRSLCARPAVAVEPMIAVDGPVRQHHAGSFLLTSVISQTPIVAGQWVRGQVDPRYDRAAGADRAAGYDAAPDGRPQRESTRRQRDCRYGRRSSSGRLPPAPEGRRLDAQAGPGEPKRRPAPPRRPGRRVGRRTGRDAADLIAAVRALTSGLLTQRSRLLVARESRQVAPTLPLMPAARTGDPPRLGVASRRPAAALTRRSQCGSCRSGSLAGRRPG